MVRAEARPSVVRGPGMKQTRVQSPLSGWQRGFYFRGKGPCQMAAALMVQGTCSGAGKSQLVAGLARILSDEGLSVAPFKSQNMALNSFITEEGAEIGRAQALQAEAARLRPTADMNPVLLKAQGDRGCQVILGGKVHGNMTAREYYAFRDHVWPVITESYGRLSSEYDVILIEGAGSPAEINLSEQEVVNMRVARHANSPVLLVGDIERGGVFASFYGTHALLGSDAEYIKGYVVNKFRGDVDILTPGLDMIRQKTGVPVVGVLPWVGDLGLDEEDGLALPYGGMASRNTGHGAKTLKTTVLRLPYISNFTDLAPLQAEPDVELSFSVNAVEVENSDIVIIPGSKNTTLDMDFLNKSGLCQSIRRAARRGAEVVGICGGYQMLGRRIKDPLGVEGGPSDVEGIGLLDVETTLRGDKTTTQTEAATGLYGNTATLRGYEIHMGETTGDTGLMDFKRLHSGQTHKDGSQKGNVWGTYLHGLFDSDGFRSCMLNTLRKRKGMPIPDSPISYESIRQGNMDRWAAILKENLDMDFIRGLLRQ